ATTALILVAVVAVRYWHLVMRPGGPVGGGWRRRAGILGPGRGRDGGEAAACRGPAVRAAPFPSGTESVSGRGVLRREGAGIPVWSRQGSTLPIWVAVSPMRQICWMLGPLWPGAIQLARS